MNTFGPTRGGQLSWHPIQASSSESLWEVPTQASQSYADDDSTDISSVYSFQSTLTNETNTSQPPRNIQSSPTNSNILRGSTLPRHIKQRKVLGDRTNNAPTLALRRSQFR